MLLNVDIERKSHQLLVIVIFYFYQIFNREFF
jgi:hypothetical protein